MCRNPPNTHNSETLVSSNFNRLPCRAETFLFDLKSPLLTPQLHECLFGQQPRSTSSNAVINPHHEDPYGVDEEALSLTDIQPLASPIRLSQQQDKTTFSEERGGKQERRRMGRIATHTFYTKEKEWFGICVFGYTENGGTSCKTNSYRICVTCLWFCALTRQKAQLCAYFICRISAISDTLVYL